MKILSLIILLAASSAFAQKTAQKNENHRESKIATLISKRGVLIEEDSRETGNLYMYGFAGADLTVEGLIASDPNNPSVRLKGLRITITKATVTNTAFFDEDDIESFAAALNYLIDAENSRNPRPDESQIEMSYTADNDVRVGFIRESGSDSPSPYLAITSIPFVRCTGSDFSNNHFSLPDLKKMVDSAVTFLQYN